MSGGRDRVFEDGPPYDVDKFLNLTFYDAATDTYVPYLAVRRLQHIRDYRKPGNAPPRFRHNSYSVVWSLVWLHRGGRMAGGSDSMTSGPFDDVYIRCWEEVPYVRNLEKFIQTHGDSPMSDTDFDFNDIILFSGRFDHMYWYNREQFGGDLWDEARLRSRPEAEGRDQHIPVFFGWHHREFHDMTHHDRNTMFERVPDWWLDRFSSARVLGVPSPWVMMYCQNLLIGKEGNLVNRIYEVAQMECSIFTTLCHVHAACYGVHRNVNCTSDFRIDGRPFDGYSYTFHGRLFNLPPGVIGVLGNVHPFYFLETSGVDAVSGFLALRRAQEKIIVGGPCVQYDFKSGEVQGFYEAVRSGRRNQELTLDAVHTTDFVSSQTGRPEAEAAYKRWLELTEGHGGPRHGRHGHLARSRISYDVTQVLNEEGYGIESRAIEARRLANDRSAARHPHKKYDQHVEKTLNDLADEVAGMPGELSNGGLGDIIGQPHMRPDDEDSAGSSSLVYKEMEHPVGTMTTSRKDVGTSTHEDIPGPETRPEWWPEEETLDETKAAMDVFAAHAVSVGRSAPGTLKGALALASHVTSDLRALRNELGARSPSEVIDLTEDDSNSVPALRERLAQAENTVQQLRGEVSNANAKVKTAETSKRDVEDRLEKAEQDLIEAKNKTNEEKHEMDRIPDLEGRIQDLQTTLAAAEVALADETFAREKAQGELDKRKNQSTKIAELESSLQQAKQDRDAEKARADAADKQVAFHKATCTQQQQRADRLFQSSQALIAQTTARQTEWATAATQSLLQANETRQVTLTDAGVETGSAAGAGSTATTSSRGRGRGSGRGSRGGTRGKSTSTRGGRVTKNSRK